MAQTEHSGDIHNRDYYTYRCKICGWECRKRSSRFSDVPVTTTGNYGTDGSPIPVVDVIELYEAETISFQAATGSDPAKVRDSACLFGEKQFEAGMKIRVATTSGTNDGDYTIAEPGVLRGDLLLSSSDSLTTETAAAAGTVTISKIGYQPDESAGGCPFCHSLASR